VAPAAGLLGLLAEVLEQEAAAAVGQLGVAPHHLHPGALDGAVLRRDLHRCRGRLAPRQRAGDRLHAAPQAYRARRLQQVDHRGEPALRDLRPARQFPPGHRLAGAGRHLLQQRLVRQAR
jgi:hypothetical protein